MTVKQKALAGAAAIEVCLLLAWIPMDGAAGILRWIVLLLAANAVHAHLCLLLMRSNPALAVITRRDLSVILLVAALLRFTVLPLEPVLSDDVYRHLWDGEVQLAGMDPYAHSPLEFLRAGVGGFATALSASCINHPELRTVYPPSAQLIAFGAAWLSRALRLDAILAWKLVLLSVEFGGLSLLGAGLHRRGRAHLLPVYAWSPLAAVEFYSSGHVDAAGVGLFAGAIGAMLLGRRALSGALIAGAVLVKWVVFPALAGVAFLKPRSRFVAAGALVSVALAFPFRDSGPAAFESLGIYSAHWEFNGMLHRLLRVDAWAAIPRRLVEGEFDALLLGGDGREKSIGRFAAACLAIAIGVLQARRGRPPELSALVALAAFLLMSPVVYPWYLLNLLPLLVLWPSRPLLLLIAMSPLTYEVLVMKESFGIWRENLWVQAVAWAPALIMLYREVLKGCSEICGGEESSR